MKYFILILIFSSLAQAKTGDQCIPAFEYLPFQGPWMVKNEQGQVPLGSYSRVSPDGRFVLRSLSGSKLTDVSVMRLDRKNKITEAYNTPLYNEAFAVQGTWRYLVDINGAHYRLKDILKNQKATKPLFKAGVTGFYATAAELPGGSRAQQEIRSLSWPNQDNGSGANSGEGALFNEVYRVRVKEMIPSDERVSGTKYLCGNISSTQGMVYALPMISMDGVEFAARPIHPKDHVPNIRIYKIGANHKDCELQDSLDFSTAKVVFGFPEAGKKAPLLFYHGTGGYSGTFYHDRNLKRTFNVVDKSTSVFTDNSPGLTKDGRIVYGGHWQKCQQGKCENVSGYVIADPFQSDDYQQFFKAHPEFAAQKRNCITENDVDKIVREQNEIQGFSND